VSSSPPTIYFNSMLPPALTHKADETDETMSWTKTSMTHSLRLNNNKNRVIRNVENVKRSYDNLKDTAPITVSVIHITFCRHATSNTLIGSYVSICMCVHCDIDKRIAATSQSMGALKTMWNCPHLELWSKCSTCCSDQPPRAYSCGDVRRCPWARPSLTLTRLKSSFIEAVKRGTNPQRKCSENVR